jgi:hypothetical protein
MIRSHPNPVRLRKVFYIPGYDPFHPRRYRELYRKEGAEQASVSGYDLKLSPRQMEKGCYGWSVDAEIAGEAVSTDFEVLVWSDIVRDSMSNSIFATYSQLAQTAWTYISTGALTRLMLLRKGPIIAALYPVFALLLQAIFALLLGLLAARLFNFGLGLMSVPMPVIFLGLVKLIVTLLVAWGIVSWFKKKDNRFYIYYLMHDYAYSARSNGANPPELEARLSEFRRRLRQALNDDADEVLVVGHSSGVHLAVSVLADLIRSGEVPKDGPKLGFLSLGQVVPMVSFLPDAWRLRADLAFLSRTEALTWVDVTAPGDGCAFALCDPVSVSGVAQPDKRWPLVLSASFTQNLSAERWKFLRWRFFRLHFQYLCAFDRPGDYDYFQISAGPLSLEERFHARAPSPSRIDVSVSKYTSIVSP